MKSFSPQTLSPAHQFTQTYPLSISDMAFNINSLSLTQEEEKTLHWDGIVAVCTGKFQNLSEAKAHLGTGMLLKKAGVQGELFNAFH